MSNPIDLTRAEEEALHAPGPRIVVKAPPGAVACHVIVVATGEACGAAAVCRLVWPDNDVTPACADCAREMDAKAQQNRTSIRIVAGV